MRFSVIFSITLFLLMPFYAFAEEPNAGFVQGLWYSAEPVFAGVPTRIYVAMRNNTGHDLTSTVRFTDNGKRIGTFEVSALEGRLVEAWVDWEPTYGEHTITATVSDAKLHIIGGNTESIDIAGITASDTLMVEYDTDRDGIGNPTDTDDDNDAVSDTDEQARGTNPLVTNPNPMTEDGIRGEHIKESDTQTSKDEVDTQSTSNSTGAGLERFVDEGNVDSFFSAVTDTITDAGSELNAYREERSAQLSSDNGNTENENASPNTPEGITHASITRTQVGTEGGLLASFVEGVRSLLSSLWTLILFSVSRILAHPAILEAVLLLVILATLYRVARRLGRRNRY